MATGLESAGPGASACCRPARRARPAGIYIRFFFFFFFSKILQVPSLIGRCWLAAGTPGANPGTDGHGSAAREPPGAASSLVYIWANFLDITSLASAAGPG